MRSLLVLIGLLLIDAALFVVWIGSTLGAEECGELADDPGWECSDTVQTLVPYVVYGFFASLVLTAVVAVVVLGLAGRWVARRARQND